MRRASSVVGVVLGGLVASLATVSPVAVAATQLSVGIDHVDGAAPFNSVDTAGYDSGPANDIVRTNDTIVYRVSVSAAEDPATRPALHITFPRGVEMTTIPGFCLTDAPASTLVPARLPAPNVPVGANDWSTLGTQTLVCQVTDIPVGAAKVFPLTVKVRPEMPQGSVIAAPTVTVNPNGANVSATDPQPITVSATAKWDLSINGSEVMPDGANTAFVKQETVQKCTVAALAGQWCFVGGYPLTLSIPDGGRGGVPMTGGNFSFQLDVDPQTIWGTNAPANSTTTNPLYGGYLSVNQDDPYGNAASRLRADNTTTNAVRNSGAITVTQPGGGGTPIVVTVKTADLSAYTTPSKAISPASQDLWAERGYVFTQRIFVEIPMTTAMTNPALDIDPVDGRFRARVRVTALESSLQFTSLDGSTNAYTDPSTPVLYNDIRRSVAVIEDRQTVRSVWRSTSNNPTATDPAVFAPGFPIWVGPSGPSGVDQGDGVVVTGETIVANQHLSGNVATGTTTLLCQAWDPSQVRLQPGTATTYPASSADVAYGHWPTYSADGAVWASYTMVNFNANEGGTQKVPDIWGDFRVQYGVGGNVGATNCEAAGITWTDDPPADLGTVTHVRTFIQNKPGWNAQFQRTTISTGFAVVATAPDTAIGVWNGYSQLPGIVSYADFMANTSRNWVTSAYDLAADTEAASPDDTPGIEGRMGDKVTLVGAMARVGKQTWNPAKSAFESTDKWFPDLDQWKGITAVSGSGDPVLPIYGPGTTVKFKLTPSLTSAIEHPGETFDLFIEDCLPSNTAYAGVESGRLPTYIDLRPAIATKTCADGETYLGWLYRNTDVNTAIEPVVVLARIVDTAPSQVLLNEAVASSPGVDYSSLDQRTARSRLRIQAPDGMDVSKTANPVVVRVDANGWVSVPSVLWTITAALRGQARPDLTNIDLIDRLPTNGLDGSHFTVDGDFISATVLPADSATGRVSDGVRILYTSAAPATISTDPTASSNSATGATTWCDAPAGGAVVSGTGTCPVVAADVTGLRILRAAALGSDERFEVQVRTSTLGATYAEVGTGQLMFNPIEAKVDAIETLMSSHARVDIVQSTFRSTGTISGYLWDDLNHDGIQDADEPPLVGVPVRVTGVDNIGNPVDYTVTTDASGRYVFVGMYINDPANPDAAYTVEFPTLPNRAVTERTNDEIDASGVDSDASPVTSTIRVRLDPDTQYAEADAGFVTPEVSKTAQPAKVSVGDEITYAVTVTNPAAGAFTDAHPAVLVDDLTDVLAVGEIVPGSLTAGASIVGHQLRWSGAIAGGASVTIQYRVKVTSVGDGDAANIAFTPIRPAEAAGEALDPTATDPIAPPSVAECGPSSACDQTTTPITPAVTTPPVTTPPVTTPPVTTPPVTTPPVTTPPVTTPPVTTPTVAPSPTPTKKPTPGLPHSGN